MLSRNSSLDGGSEPENDDKNMCFDALTLTTSSDARLSEGVEGSQCELHRNTSSTLNSKLITNVKEGSLVETRFVARHRSAGCVLLKPTWSM